MWNLTICFGPTGTIWAFLFKDKEKAERKSQETTIAITSHTAVAISDDFGQLATFEADSIHASLLEDLDLIEQARIQRALADERVKVKFIAAAKSDPTIRQAMQGGQQPILTPMGGGFRGN